MATQRKQWHSKKHGVDIAHIVDPAAKKETGVIRSVCGSTIPKDAEPAGQKTKRCKACEKYVKSRATAEAQ